MGLSATVVIPTLNEETSVEASIRSAIHAGANEIIVSDGGSTDGTVERARKAGAVILDSERIRSRQMNAGALAARSDILIFLHADTILPGDATLLAGSALETGFVFGGFELEFLEHDLRLRIAAGMINLRSRIMKEPWGDQAQFIRRETFANGGGFREIPIMEDYEMARRMKREGRTTILPQYVRTSGRRFLAKGVLVTTFVNWLVITGYHAGVDPQRLARLYR